MKVEINSIVLYCIVLYIATAVLDSLILDLIQFINLFLSAKLPLHKCASFPAFVAFLIR